jgi:class 3 adenylate cyclase
MMASFGDSNQALRGAVEIQDRCKSDNLSIRIGISAGEPIEEDGDFFGSTVNLAARLCDVAGAGEVYLSAEFLDSVDDADVIIEPVGELQLKGFAKPQRVSRVAASS